MLFGVFEDFVVILLRDFDSVLPKHQCPFKVHLPDLSCHLLIELRVKEALMDPTPECLIENDCQANHCVSVTVKD